MSQAVLAAARYQEGHQVKRRGDVSAACDAPHDKDFVLRQLEVTEDNWKLVEALLKKHASLRHPHLVELLEYRPSPGEIRVLLEQPRTSLRQLLVEKEGGLTEGLSRWVFQQVIVAVHFCHESDHYLNNIRLESVFLKDGDFLPIVKLVGVDYDTPSSRVDEVLDYFAPEYVEGSGGCDIIKCDIWACGVLLYIMLCGSFPFTSPNALSRMSHKSCYQDSLYSLIQDDKRMFPSSLSAACVDLLRQLLNPNPQKRITISGIFDHSWFKQGFPIEARAMNQQILEENMAARESRLVKERNSKLRGAVLEACYGRGVDVTDVGEIDRVMEMEQEQAMGKKKKGQRVGGNSAGHSICHSSISHNSVSQGQKTRYSGRWTGEGKSMRKRV